MSHQSQSSLEIEFLLKESWKFIRS